MELKFRKCFARFNVHENQTITVKYLHPYCISNKREVEFSQFY